MDQRQKPQRRPTRGPHYSNPDPMSNVRDMGRYGIRVMRDIAKGKFNFFNDGHIFRNLDFVKATMKEVEKELLRANIHVTAMQYTYGNSDNPDVQGVLMADMRRVEGWTLVYNQLMSVLNNAVDGNGDSRFIAPLLKELQRYKNSL